MINKITHFFFIIITTTILYSVEDPLHFTTKLDRDSYRAGETMTLLLDINIDPGYHIYSVHPDQSLKPTNIEYEDTTFFKSKGILNEPEPVFKYDQNFDMEVGLHYEGPLLLTQNFIISEDIDPGDYVISGTMDYLICTNAKENVVQVCIPKWDDFTFNLLVEGGNPRSEFITSIITDYPPSNGNLWVNDEEFNTAVSEGLLSFILFAMSMGLLALLTPCVFPMIPITVSFFTKQGESNHRSPVSAAFIYTIGIIIIFTGLGLILAFTLGATGANQLASSPLVNFFIAALFIYFAFSLFGQYEIRLPSALQQFSLKQESRGGVIGILFMAMTFTLTSFTCTVQFVGLLLVAASQGAYFWPIVGMLAFSFTFALPFFFLALFPQYLAKVPKSGGWLNSVKVTMGFLELGAAMKFLSNIDLVLGWGIFTYQSVLATWVIISLMMGIYLLGKIQLPHDSKLEVIGVPRLMLSIVFLTFGLYLGSGLFGQPIHGLIDSYLPPNLRAEVNSPAYSGESENNLVWIENFDEGMMTAKEINKPAFIDFTGYTCTNCRWMETNIFEEESVKKHFEDFVLIRLYTDGGENHREYQKMEVDRFNTAALPFYVILTPDNKEITRFPGMNPDVSEFVNFLERGKLF